MTTVTFLTEGERIVGFTVKGHAGLGAAGEDILCAAVTSAVRLTECAVNDVLGLGAPVKVKQRDASVSLKLPGSLGDAAESASQTILAAMMVYFTQLHEEYPEHLMVMEQDAP